MLGFSGLQSPITLWLFNIAMEHGPQKKMFYHDLPPKQMVILQFATLNNQRLILVSFWSPNQQSSNTAESSQHELQSMDMKVGFSICQQDDHG